VVVPGSSASNPTEVRILDGRNDKVFATVIPFKGYTGDLNVAMADVDRDGVLNLIVGAGKDHAPEVVAFAGARTNRGFFGTELAIPGVPGRDAFRREHRRHSDRWNYV
jgi:hypothetical protein